MGVVFASSEDLATLPECLQLRGCRRGQTLFFCWFFLFVGVFLFVFFVVVIVLNELCSPLSFYSRAVQLLGSHRPHARHAADLGALPCAGGQAGKHVPAPFPSLPCTAQPCSLFYFTAPLPPHPIMCAMWAAQLPSQLCTQPSPQPNHVGQVGSSPTHHPAAQVTGPSASSQEGRGYCACGLHG